ncbi:unnamed protein product [Lupinus luteus]|uniref:Uncharacterized protein n=1 Tax=Lupinus luteus TaxID=3873 RepID=A0AAV1XPJ8_LUPLU
MVDCGASEVRYLYHDWRVILQVFRERQVVLRDRRKTILGVSRTRPYLLTRHGPIVIGSGRVTQKTNGESHQDGTLFEGKFAMPQISCPSLLQPMVNTSRSDIILALDREDSSIEVIVLGLEAEIA